MELHFQSWCHIKEAVSSDVIPVMILSDLIKIYCQYLKDLGMTVEKRIHSTRFKNRILAQFDDISPHNEGKEVVLIFQRDIGAAVTSAASVNYDDEGFILAKATQILRRDILAMENEEFTGKFVEGCQESFIPALVRCLLSAIMYRGQADVNPNPYYKQSSLSISQLLAFNTTICIKNASSSQYHSKKREPPLPIYLAMLMHSEGCNLGLIQKASSLGLCISKDRLQDLSVAMGNTAIESYETTGVVAPVSLKRDLFCTAAVDNIDVNPKSSTATTSLHGTAASIHQHVQNDNTGLQRDVPAVLSTEKKLKLLPSEYSELAPAYLPKTVQISDYGSLETQAVRPDLQAVVSEDELWLQIWEKTSWAESHA